MYNRTTNETGKAKLNINLMVGEYINNITVLPVLSADDLTKKYGTPEPFIANLVDGQGAPLANATVTFNINGIMYNRTTNETGKAKLNINLMVGEYILLSFFIF